MLKNQRYYIVTTFREDIDFDNNFCELLNERLTLKLEHKIDCEIISGSFKNTIKYFLLIPFSLNAKKQVRRIIKEYFQECYLDILNSDAYLIDQEGMVIKHLNWMEVDREEAIKNGDFTFQQKVDKFYLGK